MKNIIILLALSSLSTAVLAEEKSWFDSLKSLVGIGTEQADAKEQKTENIIAAKPMKIADAPSSDGLVDSLKNSLNINQQQASGGMGAILNYVKNNISADQFGNLAKSLPGVNNLIGKAPNVSQQNVATSTGIGGLLDKASEYNDTLKSINDVKKQFEALGLKPEMISDFVKAAQSYLDTEKGQDAKQILTEGLGKLLG
ncbi:DUF2780 domain-containing protein [Algibacillus agarilyticus]|uniref:DUF2780 domain-containing protein n=1 Tax=Algibacillus agarilyticus TaxID=2234133 RepID=UPI000DD02F49|nr:DUF2780 domain-containing protein [Algibacillus agarilyticus]